MSERHIIHHQGSPRYDYSPSSLGEGFEWLGVVGMVVAGIIVIFIIEYINIILAILALLGLIAFIWFVKKNAIKYRIHNTRLKRAHRSVQTALRKQADVKQRTSTLSAQDAQVANSAAHGRTQGKIKKFNCIRNALVSLVSEKIQMLEKTKINVLQTTDKKSPKRLESKVSGLNDALDKYRALLEHLNNMDPTE